MIGQHNLQLDIERLLLADKFPQFAIFVGPNGSGKKTLIRKLFTGIYLEDNKIDSVRKLIDMSYKMSNKIFILPDADTLSTAAQNALLKIVEETPGHNYYIMTLENIDNILATIRSRSSVFYMESYSVKDLTEFIVDKCPVEVQEQKGIMLDLCETPGEIIKLCDCGVSQLDDFVQLVVDNIGEASIANAFKIANNLALKEDSQGYDIKLFWKAFIKVCANRLASEITRASILKYASWIVITSQHLDKLKIRGINKQMLVDDWIMSIRSAEE